MMERIRKLKALRTNEEGATLVEFAIVAGPLMLLLLGTIDLGYQGYLDTLTKSKLHEIARGASTGGLSVAQIEERVEDGLDNILLDGSRVDVEVKSYFDFTNVGKPEKISLDDNDNGELDPGDCYLDSNRNEEFDVDHGISGLGGPDDIVSYTIAIDSPRLFPISEMFGGSDRIKITNTTALRNQPFGAQGDIPEICEPDDA